MFGYVLTVDYINALFTGAVSIRLYIVDVAWMAYIYRMILSLEAPNKFGKSIPELGETHSNVLGCERRPVSASITSRSCFATFPVRVYKFSSHYLNNIIFIDNSLGPLATESSCRTRPASNCRNSPDPWQIRSSFREGGVISVNMRRN